MGGVGGGVVAVCCWWWSWWSRGGGGVKLVLCLFGDPSLPPASECNADSVAPTSRSVSLFLFETMIEMAKCCISLA